MIEFGCDLACSLGELTYTLGGCKASLGCDIAEISFIRKIVILRAI